MRDEVGSLIYRHVNHLKRSAEPLDSRVGLEDASTVPPADLESEVSTDKIDSSKEGPACVHDRMSETSALSRIIHSGEPNSQIHKFIGVSPSSINSKRTSLSVISRNGSVGYAESADRPGSPESADDPRDRPKRPRPDPNVYRK